MPAAGRRAVCAGSLPACEATRAMRPAAGPGNVIPRRSRSEPPNRAVRKHPAPAWLDRDRRSPMNDGREPHRCRRHPVPHADEQVRWQQPRRASVLGRRRSFRKSLPPPGLPRAPPSEACKGSLPARDARFDYSACAAGAQFSAARATRPDATSPICVCSDVSRPRRAPASGLSPCAAPSCAARPART